MKAWEAFQVNRIRLLGVAILCVAGAETGLAAIRFVDAGVPGGLNNGSAWANAYTNLQDGIAASVADSGDQIWVAQGTYYPAAAGSRTTTFQLKSGTFLYGGFTNGMGSVAERNWAAYPTILSGDIDKDSASLDPDDSENVVKAEKNTTLDGFTVTSGYESDGKGGGLYIMSKTNVTVRNCTFRDSYAKQGGAGLFAGGSSSPVTVDACEFANNIAGWTNSGANGAGMCTESCSGSIKNTLFRGNRAGSSGPPYGPKWQMGSGGALKIGETTTWTIEDCTFAGNWCSWIGGAVQFNNDTTAATFRNCKFFANQAGICGAIAGNSALHRLAIEDSLFAGNVAHAENGGGSGGALYDFAGTVRNCLFAGNYAVDYGGAIRCANAGATQALVNCTFAGNYTAQSGGALAFNSTVSGLTNSIFWGNIAAWGGQEIDGGGIASTRITFGYDDVQGGYNGSRVYTNKAVVINDGGNTNVNPLFAGGTNGSWTAGAVYDAASGKSTLTDGNAAWTTNQWAQTFVNPNTNQYRQFYVVSNSATAMTVWGDASAIATNAARYQGYDYHLKSAYGRWTASGWANDATNSALIDAGHPDFDYAREPRPNGKRVNIGAYGNTAQASKSRPLAGLMVQIR